MADAPLGRGAEEPVTFPAPPAKGQGHLGVPATWAPASSRGQGQQLLARAQAATQPAPPRLRGEPRTGSPSPRAGGQARPAQIPQPCSRRVQALPLPRAPDPRRRRRRRARALTHPPKAARTGLRSHVRADREQVRCPRRSPLL